MKAIAWSLGTVFAGLLLGTLLWTTYECRQTTYDVAVCESKYAFLNRIVEIFE